MTEQQTAAMRQALEALELEDMACRYEKEPTPEHIANAITALRDALAEPELNLNCKSVQKRLATVWGYVKAEQAEQEPVAIDGLARACNLAGIDYKDFLRIKAYLPIAAPVRQAEQEPVAEALRLSEEAIEYARQGGKVGSGIYGKALSAIRNVLGENNGTRNLDGDLEYSSDDNSCDSFVSNIALAEQEEQEPVALSELRRIAAEYIEPNSQVDSGNLFWALCGALQYIDVELKFNEPTPHVQQEPVAEILVNADDVIVLWHKTARQLGHQAKLYAAPVRTKDLTDDEIEDVCCRLWSGGWRKKAMNDFARAVIEKFKEKNNANNNS